MTVMPTELVTRYDKLTMTTMTAVLCVIETGKNSKTQKSYMALDVQVHTLSGGDQVHLWCSVLHEMYFSLEANLLALVNAHVLHYVLPVSRLAAVIGLQWTSFQTISPSC